MHVCGGGWGRVALPLAPVGRFRDWGQERLPHPSSFLSQLGPLKMHLCFLIALLCCSFVVVLIPAVIIQQGDDAEQSFSLAWLVSTPIWPHPNLCSVLMRVESGTLGND